MSIQPLEGFPSTSVYNVPPKVNGHNSVLVFIPGNPGLVEFYTTYLNLIQKKYPTLELFCMSHAGYDTLTEAIGNPFTLYDIDFQIEHKYQILKLLILEKTENQKSVDLFIMAHSFGCYVLPRTIRKLLDDKQLDGRFKIKFIGNICPTFTDIAISDSGVTFTRLFAVLPFLADIAVLVSAFLQWIFTEAILRHIIGAKFVARPKEEDDALLEGWENSVTGCYHLFRNTNIVKHSLKLAKHELEIIGKDEEKIYDWYIEEFPDVHDCVLWNFFAGSDHWVHDSLRDAILKRYAHEKNRNVQFIVDSTGITHSFCVNQSVEFSKITVEALEPFSPQAL